MNVRQKYVGKRRAVGSEEGVEVREVQYVLCASVKL